MRYSFVGLERLLEADPQAYRAEVARLHEEEPEKLDRFVEKVRRGVNAELGAKRRRASIRALVLGSRR